MAEHAGLATVAPATAPKQTPASAPAAPQATPAPTTEQTESPTFDRVKLAPPPPPATPPWTGGGRGAGAPAMTAPSIAAPAVFRQVRRPAPPGPFARGTGTVPIQIAAFDDPLEEAADRGGAPPGPVSPGPLSEVDRATTDLIHAIAGDGARLPLSLRSAAEARVGAGLPDDVRLFTGVAAASVLGTRAFAFGADVFFAPGTPSPDTASGRELLLHELAHVDQQRRAGHAFIQRENPKKSTSGDWAIETWDEGYVVKRHTKEKRAEIWFVNQGGGHAWITVTSSSNTVPLKVEITTHVAEADPAGKGSATVVAEGVAVKIGSEAKLAIKVDRDVENHVFAKLRGKIARIKYALAGASGDATFSTTNKETAAFGADRQLAFDMYGNPVQQETLVERTFALPMGMTVTEERGIYINSDQWDAKHRYSTIDVEKLVDSFPSYSTLDEVKAHIKANPKANFLILEMPDGRYGLRAVNEQQLQDLADTVRNGKPDLGYLPDFVRYKGKPARGQLLSMWVDGREVTSFDGLRDMYYRDVLFAEVGQLGTGTGTGTGTGKGTGVSPECIVFKHGTKSYGRKPLTHNQAGDKMHEIDAGSKDEVLKSTVDGHPFVLLRWAGKSKLHSIGAEYLEGRDLFNQGMKEFDAADGLEAKKAAFQKLLEPQAQGFLMTELDREWDNLPFIERLKKSSAGQARAIDLVWNMIEEKAQSLAKLDIVYAKLELEKYVTDENKLRNVILAFHRMPRKKQDELFDFFGLEPGATPGTNSPIRETYRAVMNTPKFAMDMALGKTRKESFSFGKPPPGSPPGTPPLASGQAALEVEVSLAGLRDMIKAQVAGYQHSLDVLDEREGGHYKVPVISLKGELGNHIRGLVYKELGFKADPKAYPHREGGLPTAVHVLFPVTFISETISDILKYSDLFRGDRLKFGSRLEQVFVNQAAKRDAVDDAILIAKITLKVIVAIIVMLIAHAAGAALVAYLGLTEGSLAAIAVYAAASAAVITLADVAETLITTGKLPDAGHVVSGFLLNLAMVGGFAKLGHALKGASALVRTSVMGTTFLAVSLAQYRITHGRLPEGKEWFFWFYENALMFGLMEASSRLMRPLDARIQLWGRARKIAKLQARVDKFYDGIGDVQNTLAEILDKPQTAVEKGKGLKDKLQGLLDEQKALAKEVAEAVQNEKDPAAKQIANEALEEIKAVEEAVSAMAEMDFLAELRIRPVTESRGVFEYKPGPNVVERLQKFFGDKAKIEAAKEGGVIRIEVPGAPRSYTLHPEGTFKDVSLGQTGTVETQLNLNEAGWKDIVDLKLERIGEKTARKITEARDKPKDKGGFDGAFSSIDDLAKIEGIGAETVAKLKARVVIAPPKAVGLSQRQLLQRGSAVLERADRLGIKNKAVDKLRDLDVGLTRDDLYDAKQVVDRAEAAIDAEVRKRVGERKDMPADWEKQVKSGVLSDISDRAMYDALAEIPSSAKERVTRLSARGLKAVVIMHKQGVNIARWFENAKSFGVETRNHALDLIAEAAESRIKGLGEVVRDMAKQETKWKGSLWQLEKAKEFGFRNMTEFEREVLGEGVARIDDLVFRLGPEGVDARGECKDWQIWDEKRAGKMAWQMIKRLRQLGYYPRMFQSHRIFFRAPAPRSVAEIKAFLREKLVAELDSARQRKLETGMTEERKQKILEAFDAEKDLVSESGLTPEKKLLEPAPSDLPPVTKPVIPIDRDKDKEVPEFPNPQP